jgi:hypothetical protein
MAAAAAAAARDFEPLVASRGQRWWDAEGSSPFSRFNPCLGLKNRDLRTGSNRLDTLTT